MDHFRPSVSTTHAHCGLAQSQNNARHASLSAGNLHITHNINYQQRLRHENANTVSNRIRGDAADHSRTRRRDRRLASTSRRSSKHYHNSSRGSELQELNFNPSILSPSIVSDACGSCAYQGSPNVVHWFRRGLRFHDNPSLRSGLRNCSTWRCVYVLDPWFAGASNVGVNKWRFLLQSLEDLDRTLRRFNSRLFVIRGQPANVFPKVFREWRINKLTFEEDPEPFGRVRDQKIKTICKEMHISVSCKVSHTLYKLQKIIDKNGGQAPMTYRQFHSVLSQMDPPHPPAGTVTQEYLDRHCPKSVSPIDEDHDDKYGIPTLEELGFITSGLKQTLWPGGETEALTRLERHLERRAWVASFGRPRMTPQSLMANQTGLNPYLRFGCLSPKTFYHQMSELYRKIKKCPPPLSLHGQLLWREFFYCAATNNPKFDRMEGNPICVQIPWVKNPPALAKWANGQTGYPWIDAIMTQLREEGWIHQLARHAVACFLTRGDLWLSWEEGMKVFEELLLEADWSVNAGSWMWLSCSSFFQQFFHSYCPVKFGRKVDPNGDYIRRYLPVLKSYPTKYIHEPWKAPETVQKSARCIVGKDYPLPMLNHSEVSKINVERIRQVYRRLSNFKNGPGRVPKAISCPLSTESCRSNGGHDDDAAAVIASASLTTPATIEV